MTTSDRTAFRLTALASFLYGFSFIAICYIGLPVDFTADHVSNIRNTAAISYPELFKLILNPTTPAWFYPPGDGSMAYVRPLHFLLMKFYFNQFNYSLPPFHITAAIGNGILGLVLFFFIYHWTRNLFLGFLGIVLYSSLPSNYFTMSSTFAMDFQHFIGLFTLSSLFLFGQLTLKKNKAGTFALQLLGWVVTTWLVIKLKSSEKIVPVICGAFLVLRWKFISARIGLRKTVILLLVVLGMAVLVVPFKSFDAWTGRESSKSEKLRMNPSTEKDKAALSFHWKNLIQRAFYVSGGKFPFTTLSRSDSPCSFSENFGFFLSWFFWLNLLLLPFILSRFKSPSQGCHPEERSDEGSRVKTQILRSAQDDNSCESFIHYLLLFLIWFLSTLAGFSNGLSVYDTRFLNFAYVPAMFLLFMFLYLDSIFLKPERRRIFTAILAFLILFSALSNYAVFAGLLSHFGGMQNAVVRAETDVYRDVFHSEPTSTSLYERHPELDGKVIFIDWYDLGPGWFSYAESRLRTEKVLYFFCHNPDSDRLKQFRKAGYSVDAWKQYEILDANPRIFRLMKWAMKIKHSFRKKSKQSLKILIYKITPAGGIAH